jgi:coenzyme F420-0:L-glutamate ligase / coenzyme F420-1:gamma-L-glutamate ligase
LNANTTVSLEIIPVLLNKEVQKGDDLAKLLLSNFKDIQDGDVIVVAQKVMSKKEGKVAFLPHVIPSLLSVGIAAEYDKDPKLVEVILSEAQRIVRLDGGVIITETKHGFVCANSGVDESNLPQGFVSMLPDDPDRSASEFQTGILNYSGKKTAVLISDTFGRPFREGQTNVAIGISGIKPIYDYAGKKDSFGRQLRVTAIAQADELCAAAELVMKKSIRCPFAIIRNFEFEQECASIASLLRSKETDLFR